MQASAHYRHLDAALIRLSAHTAGPARLPWPGTLEHARAEDWAAWLREIWADEAVAEAVAMASPALADRVTSVSHGHQPPAGAARGMALSLARYLVRMSGRATPFGLFAGVAPLRFGHPASVVPARRARVRVRADAAWVAAVIARLESYRELRDGLPVVVNNLAAVHGDRLVVPWRLPAAPLGDHAVTEVSVRYSPAVQAVLRLARTPVQAGDLAGKLAAEFPAVTAGAAADMVAGLVTCGVLITGLRPPSACTDMLGHVLSALRDARPVTPAGTAPLLTELEVIYAQLEDASRAAGRAASRARAAVADRMGALAGGQPVMADLRFTGTAVLPAQVAAEAEAAAGALLRLTPHPAGHPAWQDYHVRFLARYGAGAVVPVELLIEEPAGLGFPEHFTDGQEPARQLTGRDEHLLALAQQAALDGTREITLDDELISGIAGDRDPVRPAPHAELCGELRAESADALAGGSFTVAVTGVSRSAAAMTGRFLGILPARDTRRISGLYQHLPGVTAGSSTAQLSFPPGHVRLENVTRTLPALPDLISVGEYHERGPGRVGLDDLAVTADNHGLYLISLSRRRVIEPVVMNAAARTAMPVVARFLSELPRARCAALSPFAWGAAGCLPFLPRIRYGRSILAPARWRIPAGSLPGPAAPWPAWTSAFSGLRIRLKLPGAIYAGTRDRKLRLDLGQPMDLTLLRAWIDQAGETAAISEAPSATDHGWIAGRAHEILIPLAATTPPAAGPAVLTRPGPLPVTSRHDGILPGSRVLSARLYGHPDGFDTILTARLPGLLSAWQQQPRWWFIRYRDPAAHLRLRLHLARPEDYGDAATRIGAWAATLRHDGLLSELILDTYHPEAARYGTGTALEAAEAVFAADSAAVLTQLTTLAAVPQLHPMALTAASMADLAAALAGGQAEGMRWLISHPRPRPASPAGRDVVRQAISLSGIGAGAAVLTTPGEEVATAWRARRQAAAGYAATWAGRLSHVRPSSATTSLLHLHHVRARGVDGESGLACHQLARAIALSWAARRDADRGDST
jgi:lantibiotic biosynthesis protein